MYCTCVADVMMVCVSNGYYNIYITAYNDNISSLNSLEISTHSSIAVSRIECEGSHDV